jgi:hypothetical protein
MSRRLAAIAVTAFLLGQVAIAAAGLFQPRPARFGWQMYSVADTAPRAWAVDEDGSQRQIDLVGRLAVLRADVRAAGDLARALCTFEADARAVVVELARTDAETVACD